MKWNFLILMMAAVALPGRAQTGLALAPMRLELKLAAGTQRTDTLRLSNDTPGPVRVRGQILDFFIDEKMTPQFDESYPREAKLSCREWLQVSPRETEMPGHSTLGTRYTMRVPAGTPDGEYHCAAGFVTMPTVSTTEGPVGIRIAVRVVTSFYVTVGSPASHPALKDLSLTPLPGGKWEGVAVFENQGMKTFRVNGFLELRDADGRKIETVEYATIPVLPQRQQMFQLPLETALKPGVYTVYTQADVGLPEILVGSKKLEVRGQP